MHQGGVAAAESFQEKDILVLREVGWKGGCGVCMCVCVCLHILQCIVIGSPSVWTLHPAVRSAYSVNNCNFFARCFHICNERKEITNKSMQLNIFRLMVTFVLTSNIFKLVLVVR